MGNQIDDFPWMCPMCQRPLEVVEVCTQSSTIGDKVIQWPDVHLECPTCPILSIIISIPVVDIQDEYEKMKQRPVLMQRTVYDKLRVQAQAQHMSTSAWIRRVLCEQVGMRDTIRPRKGE